MPPNKELTAHVKADPNFIPSVDRLVEKAKNFWNQTAETGSKNAMQQPKQGTTKAKVDKKQVNIHHDNQNNEHP